MVLMATGSTDSTDSTKKEGRGGEYALLFGYAIAAHALARVIELTEHVLRDDVSRADDANAHGDRRPVAAEPSPRRSEHVV